MIELFPIDDNIKVRIPAGTKHTFLIVPLSKVEDTHEKVSYSVWSMPPTNREAFYRKEDLLTPNSSEWKNLIAPALKHKLLLLTRERKLPPEIKGLFSSNKIYYMFVARLNNQYVLDQFNVSNGAYFCTFIYWTQLIWYKRL